MKPLLQSIVERKLSVVQTDPPDDTIRLYCIREVLQELLLYSLCNAGFFHFAALRGDTSLRLFHDLERFSEDLSLFACITMQRMLIVPSISGQRKKLSEHFACRYTLT